MKIYPTNKIPQSAIRSIMEGALQPTEGKHPDLVVNKKFAEAVNAPNAKTQKTAEQIDEDIRIMKTVSPALRLIETGTQDKKANINSKRAILASQGVKSTTSGGIIPAHDKVSEEISNSRYASLVPGGTSIFSDKMSQNDDLVKKLAEIGEISRETNRQKLLQKANYYGRNKKTSEEIAEEQKARKLGSMDEMSGSYTSAFASSRTATPTKDETLPNLFKAIKGTMPDLSGSKMTTAQKTMIKEISQYQLAKLQSNRKNIKQNWKEAAVDEIKERVTKASADADKIIEQQRFDMSLPKEQVSVEQIKAAFNTKKAPQDTKQDNINAANKEAASIRKTAKKKETINQSSVSRAKNTVAEKAVEIVNLQQLKQKAQRMQEI